MRLSILIPVYNEASTVEELVAAVQAVDLGEIEKELILIDDASTDGTRQRLARLAEAPNVRVLTHGSNQGKGAAIRTGLDAATGELVLFQDADLEYDPGEYPRLIKPILDGEADVVYGSRFWGTESHKALYFWHSLGNRVLTLFSNLMTGLKLTDMETCYKVFRREVLEGIRIHENRFGLEPEITAKIARRKPRIAEVGISYAGRSFAEGKKIGWRDGFRAMWCILKYNLVSS